MEKKTKTFKLDVKDISKKIICIVKERLQKPSKSDIRLHTEDYLPAEAFYSVEAMNEVITLMEKVVGEIKKMPKVYEVNTESCITTFSSSNSRWGQQKVWISEIIVLPAPCKEWKLLSEKLRKCTGKTLPVESCRIERLWGKRDNIEITSTYYMALSPEVCKNVINFLGKRGARDTIEFDVREYMDDADRYNGAGEDRESEYDAICYYYLHLTIKTPVGKLKAENSFYV